MGISEHNKAVISITNFGGMACELAPADLPQGPAVIAENVDFDFIGAVRTRAGFQNEFSYLDYFSLKVAGSGTSEPGLFQPNEDPWTTPDNIVTDSPGTYASVTLNQGGVTPVVLHSNIVANAITPKTPALPSSSPATVNNITVSGTAISGSISSSLILVPGETLMLEGFSPSFPGHFLNGAVFTVATSAAGTWTGTIIGGPLPPDNYYTNTGNAFATQAVTVSVTAGATVFAFWYCHTFDYAGVSDNQGNAYSLVWEYRNETDEERIMQTTAASSGTLTIWVAMYNGGDQVVLGAAAVSNVLSVSTYAGYVPSAPVTDWSLTGGITTANPNELVIAFPAGVQFGTLSSASFTEQSPWTIANQDASVNPSVAIVHGALLTSTVTAASNVVPAVTSSFSATYRIAAVAVAPVAGGSGPYPVSEQLVATDFNLNIPNSANVLGMNVLIDGFQTIGNSPEYIQVSLTNPAPNSPAYTAQLPLSYGTVTLGTVTLGTGTLDTWGYLPVDFTPALLNDPGWGVSIVAFASDGAITTFNVSGVRIKAWLSPNPVNFDYVKTFEETDGTVLTLALDADGTFWQEDIANTPNQLTPFNTTILPDTFAISETEDDREFIAFSDLRQGTNQPYSYSGTKFNRLSQVGPGGPPSVAQAQSVAMLTQTIASGSPPQPSTEYIGTFTTAIPVGDKVRISGFLDPANNGVFTVISCNSTQLVTDNPGGVDETDPALATWTGVANTIVSITQPAPFLVSRVAIGGGIGINTGNGSVMTWYGEPGIPNDTNPSIEGTLPGLKVGATVFIMINPTGSTGGSGGFVPPTSWTGAYVVTQIGTARISGSTNSIVPCFTTAYPGAPGSANTYQYSPGPGSYLGSVQITTATITVTSPIPNLGAGDNITIAGTSAGGYNGSWNLTGELNGGQMSITDTALMSNLATYSYTVTSGTPIGWQSVYAWTLGDRIMDQYGSLQQVTVAGTSGATIPSFNQTPGGTTLDGTGATQVTWTCEGAPSSSAGGAPQVTCTGCTNGTTSPNNPFNVTNAPVLSATATTFTVAVTGNDIPSGAESGAVAVINGTSWTFDPGVYLGNSTGGTIVQGGGLASGTRQLVVLFETDNGLLTQPSPPVTFNLSEDAQAIICSQVATGPSNVIARWCCFTEAGQQGVPGAFFFAIPEDVTTVSPLNANQSITYTSTIINDNTSTSATFVFTDAVLLSSQEIDIQGGNNFQQIELGASLGLISYSNRIFAFGTNAKITNLINYSFDGGVAGSSAAIAGDTTFSPVLVQASQAYSNTATLDVPLNTSVSTGDTLILCLEANNYSGTPAITDTQTNAWTLLATAANGASKNYMFSAIATDTGTMTITATTYGPAAGAYMLGTGQDWQGFLAAVTLDGSAGTNAGTYTDNANTGALDPALPYDLIISSIFNPTFQLALPPEFVLIGNITPPSFVGTLQSAYFVNQVPGTYLPTWSRTGTIAMNGISVAFRLNPVTAPDVANNGGAPLGWQYDPVYGGGGFSGPSPLFGFSYIIANNSASPQATWGMITQGVFQDYLKVPVIQIQQKYSVRVTASCASGSTSGNLVVDLFSPSAGLNGTQYPGACVIPLASLTGSMQIFTETLLTKIFPTFVPADLQIRIYGTNLPVGAKIVVDRIEPFLTDQPVIDGGSSFLASYENNFEAFDIVTGRLGMATENQQAVRAAFTLFDQLVGVKTHSMYSTTDNGTSEPGLWSVREISNCVGTPSIHGVAIGEGFALICDQAGMFLWDGGQPVKISGEIQPLWDAINWKYGHTLWITHDTAEKRVCIGVPLATPNASLPDFPVNANPTSPNVVLMMSYRELNTAAALMQEGAVRQTFAGTLKGYILGRKWSAWSIVSPYAALCDRPDATQQVLYCGGENGSKIYRQIPGEFDDDGVAIFSRYESYGLPKSDEAQAQQLGQHRYLALFGTWLVSGNGQFQITTYPDYPNSPRGVASTPQTLWNPPADGDLEIPLNTAGYRFFVDHVTNAVGSWFKLSRICISLSKHPYTVTKGYNKGG